MNSKNRKTILLVEDEVITTKTQKVSLENYGYSVITVTTGEKAIEAVNLSPEIDLILMDIDLGEGIDGTQAAEIILKDRDIPVVFVSSHTEPEVVEKTEKITSYGYVVKNSSITVLDASIKMAFKLFEANQKINISDVYQKTMISNISDVIAIIGTDGLIKYQSSNVEKMFGWKPEDLIGTDDWLIVHPDDLERVKKEFYKLLEKDNSSITGEYRYKCKDGSYTPIEFAAVNLINNPAIAGILLNYHDITERKQAEEALRTSQERLAFVLDGSQLGYWDWNIETGKVQRNTRWAEMLGYTLAEIEFNVKQWTDLHHPDDRSAAWKSIQNHLNGHSQMHKSEYRMRAKDGQYKWILDCAKIVKRDAQGRPLRMSGTHTDITERKQAEEEIQRQLSEKEILLKEVHHRMKNNIVSIEDLLSMQLQSISNPEAVSALQDAIARVQGMSILYDKLLLGKDYQEVSIKEYTESLIEAITTVFPESRKVTIEKQIADFNLNTKKLIPIGIIINELFTNIYKYAFQGNDSGYISIILDKTENHVILTIQDNGNGIDGSVDLNKSPGFGLTIVKMLTEQLGGTFTIENYNGTRSVLKFDI